MREPGDEANTRYSSHLIFWHVVLGKVRMLECLFSSGSLVRVHVEQEGEQVNSCWASTDKELGEILFNILWLSLNVLSSLQEKEEIECVCLCVEEGREGEREREREGERERE